MAGVQRLKLIRPLLNQETATILALGAIISHLDYANALLIGLPDCEIKKLQRVQNITDRIATQDTSVTTRTLLRTLHWLPIRLRIKFKILTLVHKAVHKQGPEYLQELFVV